VAFSTPSPHLLWGRSGHLATISPRGYITITGRIKEMINRGGESISGTQIEDLIDRYAAVACVAVVAMPNPVMGERVCAYIQAIIHRHAHDTTGNSSNA
jgi:cyclohexanecarboxylate-CoA ligase